MFKQTLFLIFITFSSIAFASPAEEAEAIVNSPIYREATNFGIFLEKIDYQIASQLEPVEDLLNRSRKVSLSNNRKIHAKLLEHIQKLTELVEQGKNGSLSELQMAIVELRLGYLYQYDGDPKKEQSFFYLKKSGDYFVQHIPLGNSLHAVGLNALFDAYIWHGPLKSMQEVADRMIHPMNIKAISEGLTSQEKSPLCSANFKALSSYHLAYKLERKSFEASRRLVDLAKECKPIDIQLNTLNHFASDAFLAGNLSESIDAYQTLLKKSNPTVSLEKINIKWELAQVFRSKNDHVSTIKILKSALIDCKKIKECSRSFEIHYNINELTNRSDLNKQLVLREISQTDSDYLLFDLFQKLSNISESENNLPEAIFYQKIALSYAYTAYQKMISGLRKNGINFEELVVELFESGYRRLEGLLIDDNRLPEADEVMGFLKASEVTDFTRGEEFLIPDVLDESHLTEQEILWLNVYKSFSNPLKITALSKKLRDTTKKNQKNKYTSSSQDDLNSIKKTLKGLNETVLIRYYVTPKSLDVILTTSDSQSVSRVKITKEALKSKINDFRALLKKPSSDPIPKANELYEILFNPALRDEISKKNPETILLALDSNLRYLPFSALHDGKKYLIESVATIIYIDSKKNSLLNERPEKPKAFGFGVSKSIAGFPKLPSVDLEMKALSSDQSFAKIFMDDEFTNDALIKVSKEHPSIVHISSHFVFSPGTESNSYLLMGDGKKLSLRDIRSEKIHFNDLDLLTLSACSTGLGGGLDENGKEIDGFADLMLKSGVNSVIATLWSVSDFGSGELMKKFYEAERDRNTKNASLRKAQLSLLKSQNHNLNHPYYWAPFILIGNY